MKARKIIAVAISMSMLFAVGCSSKSASKNNASDILAKSYEQITKDTKGTTVSFYGWGGSESVNKWFDTTVIPKMKEEYNITVKRVGMDIDNILNKLLTEKQANNEKGSIDVVWLNGENFKTAKDNKLLFGPFLNKIPNYNKYVDTKSEAITTDFGTAVDNMEAPWGKANFVVAKNREKITNNIVDTASLKDSIMKNPGKFTYPQVSDFTGSAFVRNVIYDIVGYDKVANLEENEQKVKEAIKPAIDYLKEIKPYLWNKGETYPKTSAQLDNMYADNEVYFTMSYAPNEVQGKIDSKQFDKSTEFINFDKGNISNTHFLAIPTNSQNKSGAMVLINYLLSVDSQASKSIPANWGDMTVLDMSKIAESEKSKFVNPVTIKKSEPEIKAGLVPIIEKIWNDEIGSKNE